MLVRSRTQTYMLLGFIQISLGPDWTGSLPDVSAGSVGVWKDEGWNGGGVAGCSGRVRKVTIGRWRWASSCSSVGPDWKLPPAPGQAALTCGSAQSMWRPWLPVRCQHTERQTDRQADSQTQAQTVSVTSLHSTSALYISDTITKVICLDQWVRVQKNIGSNPTADRSLTKLAAGSPKSFFSHTPH